jgi:prepilin peptidase dependent protein B
MLTIKPEMRYQVGVTITEMMIALVINVLVLTGLITVFTQNLNHHRVSLESMRLNQQMHNAMDLMVNEIRRAGYWLNAKSNLATNTNTNPFMAAGTDIAVNLAGNCILFTYDKDKNGSLAAISSATDDERYGFRLINNAIQARPPGAAFDCSAAASAWEDVTDSSVIRITALTFTLNQKTITTGPGTIGLLMRSVDISITGELTSDASVTSTLTQHVRIRNDKYLQ